MKNILLIIVLLLFSCKKEGEEQVEVDKIPVPNQVVVISNNAPGSYPHIMKQDSLGEIVKDSIGPKMYLPDYGFSFLDDQGNVFTWTPKTGEPDTLLISTYTEFLELSSYNPFTSIKETFLVKKGDTVIFNFENRLPLAKVINRNVNPIELNYNRYRHEKLFKNKYSPHRLVQFHIFIEEKYEPDLYEINTINNYKNSKSAYQQEVKLLDSLFRTGQISEINRQYRKNALDGVMQSHKNNRTVRSWLSSRKIEELNKIPKYDLTKTDSLMKYSYFRDYLNDISKYGLSMIQENNGGSGSNYLDSRARFDSILKDDRFNQTAKNFLLFEVYPDINRNFTVKDKEKYFKKLQAATTDIRRLRKFKKEYNLDFEHSDQLILTTLEGDSIDYKEMIQKNSGKLLYIDFWASWCGPCRRTMPQSRKLKKRLQKENVEFIYLALNDKKEKWKQAIIIDSIDDGQHYFIENGNTSNVIEDLGIITIPHYIIYNEKGVITTEYAERPGEGAYKQIKKYLDGGK